mgnify:CR=1 FL=1
MKMEHVVAAPSARASCGASRSAKGDTVFEGHVLALLERDERDAESAPCGGRRRSASTTSRPTSPRRSTRHAVGHDAAASRGGRAPPRDRPAHRARERRRPLRPGTLRRVRRARDRGAAPAPLGRGPDREDAAPTASSPASARSTARASATERASLRRARVRLHRARRHAGRAEPPQEGPHARDRRAPAPAGRALQRGRRRAARRHRRARHRRASTCRRSRRFARLSGLVPLGRRQLGLLLRRERRAARLLRRRDRDRQLEHRHGRSGDGRGRRARRLPSRGDRADERAGAERRRRRRGRRRGRGGAASPSSTSATSRARSRDWACADQRRAARARAGEPPARLRRAPRRDDARRHRLRARAAPRRSATAW